MISHLAQFDDWLRAHDVIIDLVTVWGLVLGFGLFGIVKAVSWWTLRQQTDQTRIGTSLKRQKFAEAIAGFGMATLYSMTLYAYYVNEPVFGFWDRLAVRVGLFVAMMMVSWHGIRFVYFLRRESERNTVGTIPLARDGGKEG